MISTQQSASGKHSVLAPSIHPLHEAHDARIFCESFRRFTGQSVQEVVDQVLLPSAPRAVYLTGSIPLGMGTNGSDVDLVVLIDGKEALRPRAGAGNERNTDQRLTFINESDPLRGGLFLNVMNGVTVEVAAIMAPMIRQTLNRLRNRGPELSEGEIMTLGRLSTGWLLWQTADYLERSGFKLPDPAFDVYCSTRSFSYSLIYQLKAHRALDLGDIPQALHLGRLSVEAAYLAYFASEGMSYLGAKWLAQIGHARGAAQRLERHPLLHEGIAQLFPNGSLDSVGAAAQLQAAAGFCSRMQGLIEEKTLFRIAFRACPQITSP